MTIVSDLDISFIVSQSENVICIQSAKQSWTTCRNKTYKSLNHLSFPESRDKNGQRHFFFYKFNYLDVSCDSILFFEWMVSLRICFNPILCLRSNSFNSPSKLVSLSFYIMVSGCLTSRDRFIVFLFLWRSSGQTTKWTSHPTDVPWDCQGVT